MIAQKNSQIYGPYVETLEKNVKDRFGWISFKQINTASLSVTIWKMPKRNRLNGMEMHLKKEHIANLVGNFK